MIETKLQELDQLYLRNFVKSKVPEDAVDDITQEVNIVLIEKLNKEESIENINAFSFQVARNKIADY